jgi:hypothetical protein
VAKLALLFSGQVRNINPRLFNRALKLFIGSHDADIYISYWDSGGVSGAHDVFKLMNTTESSNFDVLAYLRLAFTDLPVKKEKVVSEVDWEAIQTSEIREIIKSKKYSALTINSARQLFQIYNSYSLVDDPEEYDYVVRCRFDSIFVFPFQPFRDISRNVVTNINFGNAFYKNRIYDIFFYSPSSCSFAAFSLPWRRFCSLVKDDFENGLDKRDACRILYLSAVKEGLDVRQTAVRYCDVYRNNPKYFWFVVQWGLSPKKYPGLRVICNYVANIFRLFVRYSDVA